MGRELVAGEPGRLCALSIRPRLRHRDGDTDRVRPRQRRGRWQRGLLWLRRRAVPAIGCAVVVLAVPSGPFWRQVYIAKGGRVQALALLVGPGGRSLLLLRQSDPGVRWRKISSEGALTSVS